ncbi:MAG: ABC transporter permease [Clostridium sp.]|uniref:ABC transporter permease n=1 Tax=Clostridium sp. TaxID=1506 RepID=UPI002FCB6C60
MSVHSKEHIQYIKRVKRKKFLIFFTQIAILIVFFLLWEVLASLKVIDPFLVSKPSKILVTLQSFYNDGTLFNHIGITLYETVIGFVLGTVVGIIIAIMLWWSDFLCKVLDPYLVILNALPKIALGPIIIFWVGNGTTAIIIIALMISLITTIISVLSGFQEVDTEKVKLLKTFGASKMQILRYVVLPASFPTMISALKINVGLSWVGVIVGEFIAGKEGLGFLITFGGQVSQLDMVMMSILILSVLAYIMYEAVAFLEKSINRHRSS